MCRRVNTSKTILHTSLLIPKNPDFALGPCGLQYSVVKALGPNTSLRYICSLTPRLKWPRPNPKLHHPIHLFMFLLKEETPPIDPK